MGAIHSALRRSLSDMFSALKGKKKATLAILGLDASGKSTLVNLFRDVNIPTNPTIGFSFEQITFAGTTINIWDIGGQKEFISYWKKYVDDIDGLVFMIDIADERRFEDSLNGFKTLVPHLKNGLTVLLFLNKTDLISSQEELDRRVNQVQELYNCKPSETRDDTFMKLDEKDFRVKVSRISVKEDLQLMSTQPSATIQHTSVYPGFKWLIDTLKNSDSRS